MFHRKRVENVFFDIWFHFSGKDTLTVMLYVPLCSSTLTEHPGSYGFKSRDRGVEQHGGMWDPLERQPLVENFGNTGS